MALELSTSRQGFIVKGFKEKATEGVYVAGAGSQ